MADLQGTCPICDGAVSLPANTEVSEVINCADCNTQLVVGAIKSGKATLSEAPAVEEDWGE